jgi:hypothetical protein
MRSDPRFDTAQDKIDDDVNETDRDHASHHDLRGYLQLSLCAHLADAAR